MELMKINKNDTIIQLFEHHTFHDQTNSEEDKICYTLVYDNYEKQFLDKWPVQFFEDFIYFSECESHSERNCGTRYYKSDKIYVIKENERYVFSLFDFSFTIGYYFSLIHDKRKMFAKNCVVTLYFSQECDDENEIKKALLHYFKNVDSKNSDFFKEIKEKDIFVSKPYQVKTISPNIDSKLLNETIIKIANIKIEI